jgi:Fe-S-cluster containining protein
VSFIIAKPPAAGARGARRGFVFASCGYAVRVLDAEDIHRWREAAAHPEVAAFFADARLRIAEVVRARRPICLASGACCRFEAYGHRMYVSGLEAAFVVARIDAARAARASNPLRLHEVTESRARGDCPYLRAGLCGEHEERPLGCRIFFCDKGADGRGAEWQSALYEELHAATIALHERLGVPYRYIEWREALSLVAGSEPRVS